jgi:hypothetical protein
VVTSLKSDEYWRGAGGGVREHVKGRALEALGSPLRCVWQWLWLLEWQWQCGSGLIGLEMSWGSF